MSICCSIDNVEYTRPHMDMMSWGRTERVYAGQMEIHLNVRVFVSEEDMQLSHRMNVNLIPELQDALNRELPRVFRGETVKERVADLTRSRIKHKHSVILGDENE